MRDGPSDGPGNRPCDGPGDVQGDGPDNGQGDGPDWVSQLLERIYIDFCCLGKTKLPFWLAGYPLIICAYSDYLCVQIHLCSFVPFFVACMVNFE